HTPETAEPFYPDSAPRHVSTTDAIDTFLNTYGSMTPEEDAMLERMIFNPTPDYANILDREERSNNPVAGEAAPGSADDRINTFIINQKKQSGEISTPPPPPAQPATPPAQPRKRPTPPHLQNDTPLSLSLAKIFIKQHHYERAYEIISQLNLNYPKKSVYFADQLRFLRKVIAIQKAKNNKSQQ
ncbi:MAG: hypothetical protein K2G64_05120, partial [Muribaculaceae bacterium]|nr:hypothetical protein [Muribaculaceae bacterium]